MTVKTWGDASVRWGDPLVSWGGTSLAPEPPPVVDTPPVSTPDRPVPTPARWKFAVGPWSAGPDVELTQATGRTFRFRKDGASECSFSIDGRDRQANAIEELVTDVFAYRESDLLYRGRVGQPGDELGPDAHKVTVPTADYRAILERRILYSGDDVAFVAVDDAEVAWALVQNTQAHTGGDLGIVQGVGSPIGSDRTIEFPLGKPIAWGIDTIAGLDDGFEWEISPDLELNVWPERGDDRGVVLDFGGIVDKVNRAPKLGDYGNALRVNGTDTATTQEREAADLAGRPEGRWDRQVGTDIAETDVLSARSDRLLEESQEIPVAYTLHLKPGSWRGPAHVWLGDPVVVVIRSGRLDVLTTLRVWEVAVSLDDDGFEDVSVTVGRGRRTSIDRDRDVARRLEELERR